MRTFPGTTSWPPKRFTPSRCAFESRPLRVEPAPFFDAKSWRSKKNIARELYQTEPRARNLAAVTSWRPAGAVGVRRRRAIAATARARRARAVRRVVREGFG